MPFDREFSPSIRASGPRAGRLIHARPGWRAIMPSANAALVRGFFSVLAGLSDAGAILLAAIGSGTIYHAMFYEAAGMFENHIAVGFVIIALFVPPGFMRKDYEVTNFLSFKGQLARGFALWNLTFLCLVILAFVTKMSADVSRGTVILLYLTGWLCVATSRILMARIALQHAQSGGVGARRVFLVGDELEMQRFSEHYEPWKQGMRIVAAAVLRGEESLDDDLALAAASARMLRPDDVYILAPWSRTRLIDAAVNAFLRVPASLHLGPERVLDRFTKARLERFGPIASLNLARKPLSLVDVAMKRVLDIGLSLVALVLLSPIFALVALAIKLDSPGPVFFL